VSRTGLVESAHAGRHDTGPGHPERAARVAAIRRRLEADGLLAELDLAEAPQAARGDLARVHSGTYLDAAERAIARGARVLDEGDTRVSAGSWQAALAAAGGACLAVDRVLDGTWENAFVLARPPGHHAERAEAMGFCVVNNVAVAAAHARHARGVERVAIVDWDVHHGNGTQHAFEADPTVFFASLHQWPLYPGTGLAADRGAGEGEGATLNRPLPPGAGEREWLAALEDDVLPAIEAFRPGLVLVSAGFDAHRDDPLASTRLETASFARMTALVRDLARRTCGGKLVSLLEGGYDLDALAASAGAHVAGLVAR
jgi:acetoin utilization deacetylase AcuC-like enzyme